MAEACFFVNFLNSMETADWLSLLGVVVNAFLAYWIVITIQNKLTNKRVLKDHFINEIKDIRNEYKICLNNLYSNNTHPLRIIPWFKLMNIKIEDVMMILHERYCIEQEQLKPYQIDLQELITNNEDFMAQYKCDKVIFSHKSRSQLIKFQQSHNQLFNDIIIKINDSK